MAEEVFETPDPPPSFGLQSDEPAPPAVEPADEVGKDKVVDDVVDPHLAFQVFAGQVVQTTIGEFRSMPPATSTLTNPMDRFFRLRGELDDLERDLAALTMNQGGEDLSPSEVWVKMGEEVNSMKQDLERVGSQGPLAAVLAGSAPPSSGVRDGLSDDLARIVNDLAAQRETPSPGESVATVELFYQPGVPAAQTSSLATLEQRVAALEQAVGQPEQHVLSDAAVAPLVDVVAGLEARLAQLDPSQVNATTAALRGLRRELTAVAQEQISRGLAGPDAPLVDAELAARLEQLYRRTAALDDLGGDLPVLVARLQTLQGLHEQAVCWTNRLSQVEQDQQRTQATLTDDRALVARLEESLAANLTQLQANVEAVDRRIAALDT